MTPTPPSDQLPPVAAPPPQPQAPPAESSALQRMQVELNKHKQEAERLRNQVLAQPPVSQLPAAQPDIRELNRQFNQNPVQMSAAIAERAAFEVASRMNAGSYDTQVQMARRMAREGNEQLFDRYGNEIDQMVMDDRTIAPNLRTSANVWTNAFNLVRGRHIDDIIRDAAAQTPGNQSAAVHIRDNGGPAPASAPPAPAPKGKTLTDEEKRFARKFNITDEQYAQGKEDNLNQSDIILNPVGKSSWDKHVTFSTDEKRRQRREETRRQKAGAK